MNIHSQAQTPHACPPWTCGLLHEGEALPQRTFPAKVSCIATNYPEIISERKADGTAKETEVEDWRVNCTITLGDKKLFDEALSIPHPTPFREAMDAINEFRTKRAIQIVKDKEKK